MKAYIKYSSGDNSVVENLKYILTSSNNGNVKITKDELSEKIFKSGQKYTFVGDRTVSVLTESISYIEFID